MVAIVPCFVSSGVGAVLFTGLGHWTGLPTGSLALPDVGATTLDWVDLVSVIPLAAAVALLMHGAVRLGRRTAAHALARPLLVPVVAGLATGALAGMLRRWPPAGRRSRCSRPGRPPCRGWSTHTWPVGVLLLLLLCKGAGYALCLGAFRGGPTFPAIFLGGAAGVLAGHVPGLGAVPGMAICMAAGMVAVLRLPVTSALLVVLLLGPAATSQMPVVMVATVTALVMAEVLDRRRGTADATRRPLPRRSPTVSRRGPAPPASPSHGAPRGRVRVTWPWGRLGHVPPGGGWRPGQEDRNGARRADRAVLPDLPRRPIYLDHNATTPVDTRGASGTAARARARLRQPLLGARLRCRAARRAGRRRAEVASLVGACATRSCSPPAARRPTRSPSTARSGRRWRGGRRAAARGHPDHRASGGPGCLRLAGARLGVAVTYVPVDREGLVDPAAVEAALRPETVLVSLMAANNETGTLQPVREVGAITRAHGVLLHVDAAQAVGKVPVDVGCVGRGPADGGGPQDVRAQGHRGPVRRAGGALASAGRGGGQERGLRAGTENVALAVALGAAAGLARAELAAGRPEVLAGMRDLLEARLAARLPGRVRLNGHRERRLPQTLNVSIDGVRGHELLAAVPGGRRLDRVGLSRGRGRAVAGPGRHGPRARAGHGRGAADARPVEHAGGRLRGRGPAGRGRGQAHPAWPPVPVHTRRPREVEPVDGAGRSCRTAPAGRCRARRSRRRRRRCRAARG